MGSGRRGGFGSTKGAGDRSVSLPKNDSQLKHIFRNKTGHLPDTPENRKLLLDLANDKSRFIGRDANNNDWNAEILPDGSQKWVRYRYGVINEGGINAQPRLWDPDTGFNFNPNNPQPPVTPVITQSANPFVLILTRGDIA